MNWQALDPTLLGPAFLAGVLVLLTHVPLGIQVLARGIVFIDLAIAQIAGLGVIAASALGLHAEGMAVQFAAAGAALAGALLLTWTEMRWPESQEALIGTAFVLAACAGVLLLAGNPHGGEHLRDLLVGQILWVDTSRLMAMAVLSAVLLLVLRAMPEGRSRLGFYVPFAIAVTASVQLVGIYLVFASLIIPALSTRRVGARRGALALAVGVAGYALGLLAAAQADLPPGPVVVWAMALCGLAVACFHGARAPSVVN